LKEGEQRRKNIFREIETRFNGVLRKDIPLFETDIYGVQNLRKVAGFLYE
jgi:hypothetical protein